MTHRNICFTSFKTEEKLKFDKEKINYIIWQLEKCPDTEKFHYQGYVEFKKPCKFTCMKKIFDDNTIHLEVRKGTQEQAINYCKKKESQIEGPWEYGEPGKQGKRNDLNVLKQDILKQDSEYEIMNNHFGSYLRYGRMIKECKKLVAKEHTKEFRKLEVIIYFGKTGVGKTKRCYNPETCYKINPPYKWWDGYEQEKELLIDEFHGQIPYKELLTILDGYQLRLEIKGGFTYANWNKVYITSSQKPEYWYSLKDISELCRRVTKSYEVVGNTSDNFSDENNLIEYKICENIDIFDY